MRKIAVVYWSGTGNTEAMAQAIQVGAQGVGAEAELFQVEQFRVDDIAKYDGIFLDVRQWGMKYWKRAVLNHFSQRLKLI